MNNRQRKKQNNKQKIIKPEEYNDLMRYASQGKPSEVNGLENLSAYRYRKMLIRKVLGNFTFHIPDDWNYNYVTTNMFLGGYLGISDTSVGVRALQCAFSGLDEYEYPTELIFDNHKLGHWTRYLDSDGVLWHLQYDFTGINDILDRYSYLLASCMAAVSINLMNTRSTVFAMAENENQRRTIEKAYDMSSQGKPLVVLNNKISGIDANKQPWTFLPIKNAFIAPEVKELENLILEDFYNEIGLNSVNVRKKERVNTKEVDANNQAVNNSVEHWIKTLNDSARKAKDYFGIDIWVELNRNEIENDSENNMESDMTDEY